MKLLIMIISHLIFSSDGFAQTNGEGLYLIKDASNLVCSYHGYGSTKSWEREIGGEIPDYFVIYERWMSYVPGSGTIVYTTMGVGVPTYMVKYTEDIRLYLLSSHIDGFRLARLKKDCEEKKAIAVNDGASLIINQLTGEIAFSP